MTKRVQIDCASDPEAVRHARSFVAATMRDWRLHDLIETAQLLVSEVVTNAILHASSPFQLVVEHLEPDGLAVEVRDRSPLPPVMSTPDHQSVHGRGLLLIEVLATRWGWRPTDGGGKVVWFELSR